MGRVGSVSRSGCTTPQILQAAGEAEGGSSDRAVGCALARAELLVDALRPSSEEDACQASQGVFSLHRLQLLRGILALVAALVTPPPASVASAGAAEAEAEEEAAAAPPPPPPLLPRALLLLLLLLPGPDSAARLASLHAIAQLVW
jgi:hypothetical protein